LLQLAEGIEFLHQNKMIHLSITPENVYLTPTGKWKLGGFQFSTVLNYNTNTESLFDFEERNELSVKGKLFFSQHFYNVTL